jgi:hypothetical protein
MNIRVYESLMRRAMIDRMESEIGDLRCRPNNYWFEWTQNASKLVLVTFTWEEYSQGSTGHATVRICLGEHLRTTRVSPQEVRFV